MEILLVALGGGLGSLTRFRIGKMLIGKSGGTIPLGTFFVNISGAIFLGFISGYPGFSEGYGYRFLGDGFLGAYTTFSTFMYEGFDLFRERKIINAVVYILLSLILGIIGFIIGFFVARSCCG